MSAEPRYKHAARLLLPLMGAATGLALASTGALWGIGLLLLGGVALIVIASGRPLSAAGFGLWAAPARMRLEQPALSDFPDASNVPDTPPLAPSTGGHLRRPSRLAIAFMFVLGFALGLVLDRVLIAVQTAPSAPQATTEGSSSPSPANVFSFLLPGINDGLIEQTIQVDGASLVVAHSELDMGQPADIFDGNFDTLMRGKGANPFIFEVRYPQPREARAVVLDLATMDNYEIKIHVTKPDGETFTVREEGTTPVIDPSMTFPFPDGAYRVATVRVEILDRRPPPQEGFHMHVRGFALR